MVKPMSSQIMTQCPLSSRSTWNLVCRSATQSAALAYCPGVLYLVCGLNLSAPRLTRLVSCRHPVLHLLSLSGLQLSLLGIRCFTSSTPNPLPRLYFNISTADFPKLWPASLTPFLTQSDSPPFKKNRTILKLSPNHDPTSWLGSPRRRSSPSCALFRWFFTTSSRIHTLSPTMSFGNPAWIRYTTTHNADYNLFRA